MYSRSKTDTFHMRDLYSAYPKRQGRAKVLFSNWPTAKQPQFKVISMSLLDTFGWSVLSTDTMSQVSEAVSFFFLLLFLFHKLYNLFYPISTFTNSVLFCFLTQICCSVPPMIILFVIVYFNSRIST